MTKHRLLLLLTTVFVLILLGAVPTAGLVNQPDTDDDSPVQNENITIDRNDDVVRFDITVNSSFDNGTMYVNETGPEDDSIVRSNISLENGELVVEELETESVSGTGTAVPIGSLPEPNDTEFKSVSIKIRLVNTTQEERISGEKRLDLRMITPSGESEQVLGFTRGNFTIEFADAAGVPEQIPVQVEQRNAARNASASGTVGDGRIEISAGDLVGQVGVDDLVTVTAFPDSNEAKTALVSNRILGSVVSAPQLTVDGNKLFFNHQLLSRAENYSVTVAGSTETERAEMRGRLNITQHKRDIFQSGNDTVVVNIGDITPTIESPLNKTTVFNLAKKEFGSPRLVVESEQLILRWNVFSPGKRYTVETAGNQNPGPIESTTDGSLNLTEFSESVLLSGDNPLNISSSNWGGNVALSTPFQSEDVFEYAKNLTEPDVSIEPNRLRVNHELLFSGASYELRVETDAPDGVFIREITASEQSISIQRSERGPAIEDSNITVTSTDGITQGRSVFKNVPTDQRDTVNATVNTTTEELIIREVETAGSVSGVWINNGATADFLTVNGQSPLNISLNNSQFELTEDDRIPVVLYHDGEYVDSVVVEIVKGPSGGGGNLNMLILAVAIVVLVVGAGVVRLLKRNNTPKSGGTKKVQPVDVSITVRDKITGNKLSAGTVTPTSGSISKGPLKLSGGTVKTKLEPGKWNFDISYNNNTITREHKKIPRRDKEVEITVPGREFTVHVKDWELDVSVALRGNSFERRGSTGGNGSYETTIPFELDTVAVEANHDLLETAEKSVSASKGSVTLSPTPRQGKLRARALLGEKPVEDVPIEATRRGGTYGLTPRESEATNGRGVAEFPELLVGKYDINVVLPDNRSLFSTSNGSATVEKGQTAGCDILIEFEYQLSRQQRGRIQRLRDELQELAHSRRRDNSIQQYYVSALERVVDEIERVPQTGYPFLKRAVDSDKFVDAMLDAVEKSMTMLDDALSTQRNLNLFSACSDLPEATVAYDGSLDVSIPEVLRWKATEIGRQRSRVREKRERVDEQISEALRDLSEVSPARTVWENTSEVFDQGGISEMKITALNFVFYLLLDAIESMFERQALRERLNQTPY